MPEYRFRGAVRSDDGGIGSPLIDEVFDAADRLDAIRLANAREQKPGEDAVDAFWLTDAVGGLVWSLRRADRPT